MKKFIHLSAILILSLAFSLSAAEKSPWTDMYKTLKRIVSPSFPDKEYVITDYYNGTDSLYTSAILSAIKDCSSRGGGIVVIPAGTWKTGPIRLLSNVNLHLSDGATLLFSDDVKLFDIVHTHWEGIECYNVQPLIYAEDAENIAVTGKGIIDGQAGRGNWYGPLTRGVKGADGTYLTARDQLYQWCAGEKPVAERHLTRENPARPQTINFMNCKNILLEDITIHRSPFWDIHPVLCSNMTLRRVTMDSLMGNNDGCDPESCTDVLIENCIFNTGDDCIAIKSGRDADGRRINVPSSNIIVRNCSMRDGHAGVAIGSEISGGFKNLWVEDCEMNSPHLARVIRIKSNPQRGGSVSNVNARNIKVGECDLAVLGIELVYGRVDNGPYPLDFKDITLENITSGKSRYVVHIDGREGSVGVHNITIRNSDIEGVTEPELSHIVGAENVVFDNVTVNGKPYTWRAAVIPAGAVVVAKDGSGNFTTIQAAINSLRSYKPEGRACVYVKKGVYEEKLTIPPHKTEVSLIGEDRDGTVIIWHDHANMPDKAGGSIGTFESWTMRVDGPDFICENLTIVNDAMTYHNPNWAADHKNNAGVGQAVALHIEADRVIFRNCNIKGFQDTLFTGNSDGREYFENCYIEGAVDFMFGPATVWFERCGLKLIQPGYFTAASTPAGHPYGYIFNHCTLTAADGLSNQCLGRPWRNYAYVLWKECKMDLDLNPAGWNNWGDPAREKTARFLEYKCTGRGAVRTARVPWSRELGSREASKVTLENVFHQPADNWKPQTYIQ